MTRFASFAELRTACLDLPSGDPAAAAKVASRETKLTKPPRSLGRLEEMVEWLSFWQGLSPPRLDKVEILVFAGNHGVTARGVSAYPAEVTAQMVANFAAGGAAINQLARIANAELQVLALDLECPTADFTEAPAMDEAEFLDAVAAGYKAVPDDANLVVLGEMGIGNTTSATAVAAALFGGGGTRFAGHGTGVDEEGLRRKQVVIDQGLARHSAILGDALRVAAALGGRELAVPRRAAYACSGADRRLRFDGCGCAFGETPRRRARPCARWPQVCGGRASPAARRAWPSPAARSQHAARRRVWRRSGSACASRCARLPHRHGDFRRGQRLRQGELRIRRRRWSGRRCH